MLKRLDHPDIPLQVHGPILVDPMGLPRYWATIWSVFSPVDLANTTREKHMRYIEALYSFADSLKGCGLLDAAIAEVDLSFIGEILEAYFISIQNQPLVNGSDQAKWHTAFEFLRVTLLRLSKSNSSLDELRELETRLNRLNLLYQQLRIKRQIRPDPIRSLPASVVEALYLMLDPASSTNPFRNDRTKWQVFVIFIVLLHQGLRRGELLSLPIDVVKGGYDKDFGSTRYWLSVQKNPYADEIHDTRYNKPSIKTVDSIRQIPVSELTANILQEYIENYRGKPEHPFLINSQHNTPLSTESITLLFKKISQFLPVNALRDLELRTGKTSITAHDLRHTCAVIRLNQLLQLGDSMDVALQKMRSFFGWSRSSDMPRKYAKAVFEDRLASVWNNVFDDRIALLRAIPRS
ncbi:tyrosine-type recombinase/integrase [Methylovorus sp. SPW-M1]